jgi:hypothetical protein
MRALGLMLLYADLQQSAQEKTQRGTEIGNRLTRARFTSIVD